MGLSQKPSGTECAFKTLLLLCKLDDLHSSLNIPMTKLQRMKLVRQIANRRRRRNANRCLVDKHEGNRKPGKTNLR
jgi:hypothetical protein